MKRNKCRELLYEFYVAWLAWAEDGAQTTEFRDNFGLCSNILYHMQNVRGYKKEEAEQVFEMFQEDLKAAGFANCVHPFNYDHDEYWREAQLGVHHWNVQRLEWVREQIALHDEEEARRVQ